MTVTNIDSAKKLRGLIAYTELGWHIFPIFEITEAGTCSCPDGSSCGSPGKHPRTPKGFKNATVDPDQIKRWHKRWPSSNWGLACGPSGLAVVDIDPRNQGDNSIDDLQRQHGKLPDTVSALTGGGGEHHLYAQPTGDPVNSGVLALGVEVKAEGGYIVIAPSNHIAGRHYHWESSSRPRETDVAPLPLWIIQRLRRVDTTEYEQGGDVEDGFLGASFAAAGWLGKPLGPDKQAARCPWEDEHTCGKRFDGSTVIFAPRKGSRVGWFFCRHSHCEHRRSLDDVLSCIPEDAKKAARDRLGLDPAYEPSREPVTDPSAATGEQWEVALKFTNDGRLARDAGNAALILANLDAWRGTLEYDAFSDRVRWSRPVPDLPGLAAPRPGDDLADHHVLYVHHWLARVRGVSFPKTAVQDALEAAAKLREVHPVRDYLDSLQWDRVHRLPNWLQTYLGATSDPYIHAAGRWWAISAVARIYQPGCQADHLLVLEGGQGAGKSQAARILGGEWFLANLPDVTSKDAAQVLQGHWIAEIGELDAFKGAAGTRVKDWVTRTTDSYRPAYGRFTVKRPRQTVFIGTTNESHYLTDPTGARRFWPVRVGGLDREALLRDRDQLWAEAKHYFDCGEPWWPGQELAQALSEAQEDRYEGDDWERRFSEWAETQNRDGFTVGDVLAGALGLEPGKWDRRVQTRAGFALRRIGFWSRQTREDGARVRRYYRKVVTS